MSDFPAKGRGAHEREVESMLNMRIQEWLYLFTPWHGPGYHIFMVSF